MNKDRSKSVKVDFSFTILLSLRDWHVPHLQGRAGLVHQSNRTAEAGVYCCVEVVGTQRQLHLVFVIVGIFQTIGDHFPVVACFKQKLAFVCLTSRGDTV